MFNDIPLNQLLVLGALLDRDMYGYEIVKEVEKSTGRRLILGSLYNTLKAMERKKMVKGYWSDEESAGGRRKYFEVTSLGESILDNHKTILLRQWEQLEFN